MNRRMERVNVLLRQEISRIVAEDLNDPRLRAMVSVMGVDAARDLRSAKVYVSILGNPEAQEDTLKALKSASGFVHKTIRHTLTLRAVPTVEFILDESLQQGTELLKRISEVAPGPEEPA